MRLTRWFVALTACLAIGFGAPAIAGAVRPHTSYNVDRTGVVVEAYCNNNDALWDGTFINTSASTLYGTLKVVVDGVTIIDSGNHAVANANTSAGVSGILDSTDGAYTTAYFKFTPSGSNMKAKEVKVDFPDNKDCS